jgi:hypothetical protein
MRQGKAELHAAGDPCPAYGDQAIFDDVVVKQNLPAIDLVIDGIDVAAQLRKNDDLQIFVFEIDGAVGYRDAIIG